MTTPESEEPLTGFEIIRKVLTEFGPTLAVASPDAVAKRIYLALEGYHDTELLTQCYLTSNGDGTALGDLRIQAKAREILEYQRTMFRSTIPNFDVRHDTSDTYFNDVPMTRIGKLVESTIAHVLSLINEQYIVTPVEFDR